MKISVCIPTYNQASYIVQSIRSVLNQTLLPDEIIVSDDCSTDNTRSVLEKLKDEIPILKVVYQNMNLGVSKNTDKCLRLGNGEYIVRLDSDDLLLPNYLETLSELLSKYPKAGYAHGGVQEIDAYGNTIRKRLLFRKQVFIDGDEALKASKNGYKVAANIIMFRKSTLESVNYIESKINFVEDYYLSVSIAKANYGNVYSGKILSCYRVWTDSGKVRIRRKMEEITGIRNIFENLFFPAYNERRWSTIELRKSMERFAIGHSSCLSWDIYSSEEKQQLEIELLKLSNSDKTRLYIFLYKNGFSIFPTFVSKIRNYITKFVKKASMSVLLKNV